MSDDLFKLPATTYDRICKIIQAYGLSEGKLPLKQASVLSSMSETDVSRNSGFLVQLGVLEPGKEKASTSAGEELAKALHHEQRDAVVKNWSSIIEQSDFLQKILSAVTIRKGMTRASLASHIAYSAGQKKTQQTQRGANTVIDLLLDAEYLVERDETLYVEKFADESNKDKKSVAGSNSATDDLSIRHGATIADKQSVALHSFREKHVTININITAGADEVEQVLSQIQAFLENKSGS